MRSDTVGPGISDGEVTKSGEKVQILRPWVTEYHIAWATGGRRSRPGSRRESMRRSIVGGLMAAGMLLGGLAIASSGPVFATTEHCPDKDHPAKVAEGERNSIVAPEDAEICVKGGTFATGKITADGK